MSESPSAGTVLRSRLAPLILVLPVAAVAVATARLGSRPYEELSRQIPGTTTSETSALLNLVVVVASTICTGALFYGAFLRARAGRDRMRVDPGVDYRLVRWSSGIWALTALILIAVDGADARGLPLSRLLTPGAAGYLLQASYLPGAWVVVAIIASLVFVAANFATGWQSMFALFVLSAMAVLAPLLVTQVLVGPNHDFGSDATIIGAPVEAAWFGATLVVALRTWGAPRPALLALRRLRTASLVCMAVVAASLLVVSLFELAGTSPIASPTGWLFLIQFALLAVMALLMTPAWRHRRDPESARLLTRTPTLFFLLGSMAAYVAVDVIRSRIPPPQFFVPTSIMQLFFGYDVKAAPSWQVLVFDWRPSILFITMAVVASGLYLYGVRRLRRRGDSWSVARTTAWISGWAVVVLTTSSGLGKYSSASFSLHMVLHMCLNMVGPLLMVLGGAVTLALRATTAHPSRTAAGPHEWLTGLLNGKLARAAYNPLWVFVRFIGSYYVLYLTPIFGQALRYHWAHQVMNLEFLVVGYMFYGLVIGVDHTPRQLPHIGRLGLVLAAMPFHAFFGVIVMTSQTVIAKLFYQYVDAPWMGDLHADQYLGGGIAWAAGEIPLLFVVVVLAVQWARQDERQARRADRHLDSGLDDSYEIYNQMLAQLATRDTDAPSAASLASADHEEAS